MMTDKEYRSLFLKDAENARHTLFDEYCGYVYSVCSNKLINVGSKEDTDECLSDCFAEIFRYLDENLDTNGELKGIIGTISKRTAIDYYRRLSAKFGKTLSIEGEEMYYISSEYCLEEEIDKSSLRQSVINCIEKLGEPDSSIIIYHYFYGKTTKQIASSLNMKGSAIQKRLCRAREKLKAILSEAGINEEGLQ